MAEVLHIKHQKHKFLKQLFQRQGYCFKIQKNLNDPVCSIYNYLDLTNGSCKGTWIQADKLMMANEPEMNAGPWYDTCSTSVIYEIHCNLHSFVSISRWLPEASFSSFLLGTTKNYFLGQIVLVMISFSALSRKTNADNFDGSDNKMTAGQFK